MLLFLIAIVLVFVAGVCMLKYSDSGWQSSHDCAFFLGQFSIVVGMFGFAAYILTGWNYIAAEERANIINREFGTNYTQAEMFYAGDVIMRGQYLHRNKIQINGDIMCDKKDGG